MIFRPGPLCQPAVFWGCGGKVSRGRREQRTRSLVFSRGARRSLGLSRSHRPCVWTDDQEICEQDALAHSRHNLVWTDGQEICAKDALAQTRHLCVWTDGLEIYEQDVLSHSRRLYGRVTCGKDVLFRSLHHHLCVWTDDQEIYDCLFPARLFLWKDGELWAEVQAEAKPDALRDAVLRCADGPQEERD